MKRFFFTLFFVLFVVFLGCVNNYFTLKNFNLKDFNLKDFGLEGFTSIMPASYNSSPCSLLLNDMIESPSNPSANSNTYALQSSLNPIMSAKSLQTNNIKRTTPDNGSTVFPELSTNFYNKSM